SCWRRSPAPSSIWETARRARRFTMTATTSMTRRYPTAPRCSPASWSASYRAQAMDARKRTDGFIGGYGLPQIYCVSCEVACLTVPSPLWAHKGEGTLWHCSAQPRMHGDASRKVTSPLRDELARQVGIEALDAAFMAVARLLDAAERRLRGRDRHAVDADHAGLQRIADQVRGLRRRREGVGRQAVFQRVRALDHFVEA